MSESLRARAVIATALEAFWFKLFGTTGFTLAFLAAYLYLLHHPQFAVYQVPAIWADRVVGFQPAALPAYLSLWVYVSLPPLLMSTRGEICRYGVRMGVLCLVGLAFFLFLPSAVPPADIDWSLYPQVEFLKRMDAAGNACPSLHVATAVFSCIWLFWRLRLSGAATWVQCANLVWCLAIVYSTMAIKQHMALDVLAGMVLAFACAGWTGLRAHACRR